MGIITQRQIIINDYGCEIVLHTLISMLADQIYFAFIFIMYYKNVCNVPTIATGYQ